MATSAPNAPKSSNLQSQSLTVDPIDNSDGLYDAFASALPEGFQFGIYHLSSEPTPCDALFNPLPGGESDKTYRESHFLAVSVDVPWDNGDAELWTTISSTEAEASLSHKTSRILAFAYEFFVFSTAHDTTIFVSKADSSGYLGLLGLPRGALSPIRTVAAAFVKYLVAHRRRPGLPVVVSLFARAQGQYLFPASIENPEKHVLDDRGLVRWWCRVLDPLVRGEDEENKALWSRIHGYLVVPGLEPQETRLLLPRTPTAAAHWTLGHPLERISHHVRERGGNATDVPPRCLVPKFPDDPKARFLCELDLEAEAQALPQGFTIRRCPISRLGDDDSAAGNGADLDLDIEVGQTAADVSSKSTLAESGAWKSVHSLDQFWDMMAFRQECSSGRMTGFLWVVYEPTDTVPAKAPAERTRKVHGARHALHGPLPLCLPRALRREAHILERTLAQRPARTTPFYAWPRAGRGTLVLEEVDYKAAVEELLELDFGTRSKAVRSTHTWLDTVAHGQDWRRAVTGRAPLPTAPPASSSTARLAAAPNDLSCLVKRKRALSSAETGLGSAEEAPTVNVLRTRKRPKDAT